MAQVKQKYADLVDGKTRVMDCIKSLNREPKPSSVHSIHPLMGKHKDANPYDQKQNLDLMQWQNTPPITERKNTDGHSGSTRPLRGVNFPYSHLTHE